MIWARLLVLFLSLVSIKLALLVCLRKHLFEIHWRVEPVETNWGDQLAFFVFVCLGVLSLFRFGRHCQLAGVKAVRTANATVVGLGLLFVFLTFHTGPNNYLFPILDRLLKWSSLIPYLSLDFFFRAPFLAAWILGYAFMYYVLIRTGRERLAVQLTALCGGAYGMLFLGELATFRYELLALDCLGLLALVLVWRPGTRVGIGWVLLPAGASFFVAGELLWLTPHNLGTSFVYFMLLVVASVVLFGTATLLARKHGYARHWIKLVFFYFAAFLLLTNTHHPIAMNFNRALCLGIEWPQYFLGELLLVGGLAVVALVYGRLLPRAPLWWLDAAAFVVILVAFVDLRLVQILGVRLEWDLIALGNSPKMIWRMAKPYLPSVLAVLTCLMVVYAFMIRRIGRMLGKTGESKAEPSSLAGLAYIAGIFVFLGLLGWWSADRDKARTQSALRLVQTSPIWKRNIDRPMANSDFARAATELGMGDLHSQKTLAGVSSRRDLNVLLVFMESSHSQNLSLFGGAEETQPLLAKYRDRMELFPNIFSNFASSIHARFATFTSLYPVREFNAFTLERVPVRSLFEVMHDNGYACSMFYSSFLDFTGFRDFLAERSLDPIYDADTMPGQRQSEPVAWGLREEETLGAIQQQIRKYATNGQKFFLTYVPAAPHQPFEKVPERFRKYPLGAPGDATPVYLNELLYMDWVISSILDQLKESGLLDHTLVVITDDHGEMLGANKGPIGHGWLLTPELANIPLIIMDPQKTGCRVNSTIGSQVDLLPTVLDLLGISAPPDELYQGRSLYAQSGEPRLIYLNSYQQYGVLTADRLLLGDREREAEGTGCHARSFIVSNEGTKTVFNADTHVPQTLISIRKFDDFQENLLKNYSYYRNSHRQAYGSQSLISTR